MQTITPRATAWAASLGTPHPHRPGVRRAHASRQAPRHRNDSSPAAAACPPMAPQARAEREATEAQHLSPSATRADGAGRRHVPEEPDPWRTCFERDRDRILHSTAFRRLAGKTQVFVFPGDHQRTRLTHALEVAQIATSIARACRLNVALTESIALGHDCGHSPGGHAGEDALDPFLPGGFDHAPWGADVVLEPLNLCMETLDGVRNHSWSRPAPATPEGEVVSWADRIAYVCHDFEDAVAAGVVRSDDLPRTVAEHLGTDRGRQLDRFVTAVVSTTSATGSVGMDEPTARLLDTFRAFNYERIYMRPASVEQAGRVVRVLRALTEHLCRNPHLVDPSTELDPGGDDALHAAVAHVAGMTDRYAFATAVRELDWPLDELPRGIDLYG